MSLTLTQEEALDPRCSLWITASAGSGKTHLLTLRMASLVVHGGEWEKLVCLTFTKKAAQEMHHRLFSWLHQWAAGQSREVLERLLPGKTPRAYQDVANHLYKTFLERPPIIQTFHGFCLEILNQFPLEAGLSLPLVVLDEEQAFVLWKKAINQVLFAQEPSPPLSYVRLLEWRPRLKEACEEAFFTRERNPGQEPSLCFLKDSLPPRPELPLLALGSVDAPQALYVQSLWRSTETLAQSDFDAFYPRWILTTRGPEKPTFQSPIWKKWLAEERLWLKHFQKHQELKKQAQQQKDFHDLIQEIRHQYSLLKNQTSQGLDFEDLTLKTLALLEHPETMGWVGYQLDQKIHHLLIDEAQDTNPVQWALLQHLVENLCSQPQKTLCVVGDPKQSIYSFQGANIEDFERMRNFCKTWIRHHQGLFREISLATSFRSGKGILDMLNHVFSQEKKVHQEKKPSPDHMENKEADSFDKGEEEPVSLGVPFPLHQPHFQKASYSWWVSCEASDLWSYAQAWKKMIQALTSQEKPLDQSKKIITEDDIMILFVRRTKVYDVFCQVFSQEQDFGNPKENPSLQSEVSLSASFTDLLPCATPAQAIAFLFRALLSPNDDEALVYAAKLCFPSLSSWQLMDAFGSRTCGVRHILDHEADQKGGAWTLVRRHFHLWRQTLLSQAWSYAVGEIFHRPYLIFSEEEAFYTPQSSLAKTLEKRWSWQAIEEVLFHVKADHEKGKDLLCWAYETSQESFGRFTTSLEQEKKRNLEGKGPRLMTIHGSKGLQAPIVIIPDLPEPLGEEDQEYWRLLYVALTRAQDHLFLGSSQAYKTGWYPFLNQKLSSIKHPCISTPFALDLHPLAHSFFLENPLAFFSLGDNEAIDISHLEDQGHQAQDHQDQEKECQKKERDVSQEALDGVARKIQQHCLHPSREGEEKNERETEGTGTPEKDASLEAILAPWRKEEDLNFFTTQNPLQKIAQGKDNGHPFSWWTHNFRSERGQWVHHALDLFAPRGEKETVASSDRIAQMILFFQNRGLSKGQAHFWAQRVEALFLHPDLAPLFPKSRSEVEILMPSGQVKRLDFLAVQGNQFWIVDFKTQAPYLMTSDSREKRQVDFYAELISTLFPKSIVHKSIAWVRTGEIIWW